MLRQARLDAPETLDHVIVRGIEKQRIVQHRKDRKEFSPEWNGRTGSAINRKLRKMSRKQVTKIKDVP